MKIDYNTIVAKKEKGDVNMKVKFTISDLDALEEVYYELEGTIPANTTHVPKEATSRIIGDLWHRMAECIQKEEKKKAKKLKNS